MARCDVGATLYAYEKVQRIFLTVEISKGGVSMACAMKEYLCRCHDIVPGDVVIFLEGRNTAGETDAFLSRTRIEIDLKKIYVVSTWYHIPRILFLWWVRRRMPQPAISWRGAHMGDMAIEPLKMANAILRPFRSAKVVSTQPA